MEEVERLKKLGLALGAVYALMPVVCTATWAQTAKEPTRVQLWFDTEDYTFDRSNDAIVYFARTLEAEGIRGHFNLTGYLGRFLVENGRSDVVEALKPHLIGLQTKLHSWHPTICEYTDIEDYDEAYRLALREESEGVGMLKAAFGDRTIMFAVMPGPSSSYVALDAYADMGIPFFGGLGAFNDGCDLLGQCYYQNLHHVHYNTGLCLDDVLMPGNSEKYDLEAMLNDAATRTNAVMYVHPHMLVRMESWDIDNMCKTNAVEFGKWVEPRVRPETTVALFKERFRAFIRRIKDDPRFVFADCEQLQKEEKPRVAITRADIPAIRASLTRDFGPVSCPASWCVADCFQAAVRILRGEKEYVPGKVYGFLERPVGVEKPVTIKAEDLRAAAEKIVFKRHLPVSYDVGGVKLGPADFLFAMLEVLETGVDAVTVIPRDQLGDIAKRMPKLARFRHRWIIYGADFKDEYLSDRLRWQYWTLRY